MNIEHAMELPIDTDMVWDINIYGTGDIRVCLIRQGQGEYYSQDDLTHYYKADTIANAMLECWADWRDIPTRRSYEVMKVVRLIDNDP